MPFTVWKMPCTVGFRMLDVIYIAARTCFSKVFCPLRTRKQPCAIVFRRLDSIYGAENCHGNFVFKGSMSSTILKIAALTCFSRVRCLLRSIQSPRALAFQVSKLFMKGKNAARLRFSKTRCHIRPENSKAQCYLRTTKL